VGAPSNWRDRCVSKTLELKDDKSLVILFDGANALNTPPGVYDRKVETQRN
jgi:hypothetical protein